MLRSLALLLVLAGCEGVIGEPPAARRPSGSPGAPPLPDEPLADAPAPRAFPGTDAAALPTRVWRLTDAEYRALVEDALGGPVAFEDDLLVATGEGHYANALAGLRMPRANVDALDALAAAAGAASAATSATRARTARRITGLPPRSRRRWRRARSATRS